MRSLLELLEALDQVLARFEALPPDDLAGRHAALDEAGRLLAEARAALAAGGARLDEAGRLLATYRGVQERAEVIRAEMQARALDETNPDRPKN